MGKPGKRLEALHRVLRHRINRKYDRMLRDLILMKRFLELDYHP